jgi:hypothetical protein
VNTRATFVAHGESSKAMQPSDRPFDDPTCATETAAMATAVAIRNQRHDAALPERGAVTFRVISAVALDHVRLPARAPRAAADRRQRIDQIDQLGDVRPIRGGQRRDERNPVRVGKNMMLRPGLAAIGRVRSSFFPPRMARSEALSTTARARSRRPRRRSSVSRTACNRFHTPARCHRTSRRQQVIPEPQPISRGNMRQGMPLRSTKRIPVRTARSGIGARPAYRRFRARRFGKSGSIRFHRASSSKGCGMPDRLRIGQATVPSLNHLYKRLIG